jgi:hypothetical protein
MEIQNAIIAEDAEENARRDAEALYQECLRPPKH